MQIPEHYRRRKLAESAGTVPIDSQVQGHREMARAGQILTQMGLQAYDQIKQAEYHDEMTNNQVMVKKAFFEYQQGLGADTENYESGLEETQSQIAAGLKFKNARAQNDFGTWFENEKLNQQKLIEGKKNSVDTRNFIKNFNLSVNSYTDLIVNAETEGESLQSMDEAATSLYGVDLGQINEQGVYVPYDKPKLIEGWENPLLDSDEVRLAGADAFIEKVGASRQEKVFFEEAVAKGSRQKAYEFIENSDMSLESKRIVSNKVADYFAQMKAEEVNRVEKAIEDQRENIDNLTKKLSKGEYIDRIELIRGNIVDPLHKKKWDEIISGQQTKPKEKTDWKAYNKLESSLFKDIKKDVLQTDLAYALMVTKSISRDEYKELISRLDVDISDKKIRDVMINMESVFSETKGSFRWPYTQANAKDTAIANQGLYDYVSRKMADGKFPTKKEMREQAGNLETSIEETTKAQYMKIAVNEITGEIMGYNGKKWVKIQ